MTGAARAALETLEERLRVLEAENDSLTEQAEGIFLLGKVAEALLESQDPGRILDTLMERAAIVTGVPYAGAFVLGDRGFEPRACFASFHAGVPAGLGLTAEPIATSLCSGAGAGPGGWPVPEDGLTFGEARFTPAGAVAVPFRVRSEPPGVVVVADDRRTAAELASIAPVLAQIIGMATARLENLSLLDELRRLNDDLEEKVRARTGELQAANRLLVAEVAERRRAEEALRQSATVFDSALEGVVITGPDERIVAVNRAFCELTGYSEEEVLGKRPKILQSGRHDRAFYDALWLSVRQTGRFRGEIWNRRKDGAVFPEILTISAVKDEHGTVTHYAGVFSDISAVKESEARLTHVAHHDPLTGLPNRLLFHGRVDHAVEHARRFSRRSAVLLLDLDRFESVNETLGHPAGDELLSQAARRLGSVVRGMDTVARLAADEFAVLLDEISDSRDAGHVAGKLLEALEPPFVLAGHEVYVTASVGIGVFPEDGDDHSTLVRSAGAALRRARERGRNSYEYYTAELTRAAVERLALETALRRAFAREELVLHYQPQVALASGRVVGLEALIRWQHPERGLLAPAQFLGVAEEAGLMEALDEWVLQSACAQASAFRELGFAPLRVAVNVSAQQLSRAAFAEAVVQVLEQTGLDPCLLELEITESFFLEHRRDAVGTIEALKRFGVAFAIDDFGTGYSSLSQLRGLPVDRLKIDQAFIRRVPGDAADEAVARAVISLGHSLSLAVIAEGVESPEQVAVLREGGCDEIQGYLVGRPVAALEIPAFLRRHASGPWQPPGAPPEPGPPS